MQLIVTTLIINSIITAATTIIIDLTRGLQLLCILDQVGRGLENFRFAKVVGFEVGVGIIGLVIGIFVGVCSNLQKMVRIQ